MKSKIIQQFKGTINGVEVFDKVTFYTCDWILGLIEDKFDMEYLRIMHLLAYRDQLFELLDS